MEVMARLTYPPTDLKLACIHNSGSNMDRVSPGHTSFCGHMKIKKPKMLLGQTLGPRDLNMAYIHIMILGATWAGFHVTTPLPLSVSG